MIWNLRIILAVLVAAGMIATVAANRAAGGDTVDNPAQIIGAVFLGPLCSGTPTGGGNTESDCKRDYRPVNVRLRIVRVDGDKRRRTVRSGPDGRFALQVPAGEYAIRVLPVRGAGPTGDPRQLTLEPGEVEDVIIDYDTGIR